MIAFLLILFVVANLFFLIGWIACAVFTEATVDSRLPYHGEASTGTGFAERAREVPSTYNTHEDA